MTNIMQKATIEKILDGVLGVWTRDYSVVQINPLSYSDPSY